MGKAFPVNRLRFRDLLAALHLLRAGDLGRALTFLRRALRGAAALSNRGKTMADRVAIDPVEAAETLERVAPAVPAREMPRGQFLARSFGNAAGTRTYKLYVPGNYGRRPCPLIVMLHGCTQSPDDFAAGTKMNVLAEQITCLVAYPAQPTSENPGIM